MKILKIAKKYFSTTRKKQNINAKNFSFIALFAQFSHLFDGCIIIQSYDYLLP